MRLPQLQVSRIWVKVGTVSFRTIVQKSAMTILAQRAQHRSRISISPDYRRLKNTPEDQAFRARPITIPYRPESVNER